MQKIKPKDLLLNLQQKIHTYDDEEAKEIAMLILEDHLNLSKTGILLNHPVEVSEGNLALFDKIVERLNLNEPIQYILGEQWFRNRKFNVAPGVLIPRPETEELIDIAIRESLKMSGRKKVLDIGTGSGCIAVSLAAELKESEVYAIDISETALKIAHGNSLKNSVSVTFVKADILDPQILPDEKFHIIISNPPYVKEDEKAAMRKNVLDYEPDLALFVPDNDPLVFYRAIADFGNAHLAEDGFVLTEINSYLGPETKELFEKMGYGQTVLIKDFFEKDRFVLARHE